MFLLRCFLLVMVFAISPWFVAYADSCDPGFYSENNECVSCPAGYSCNGNGNKIKCSGNTISEESASECTECSGETPFANNAHTECVACNGDTQYVVNGVCKNCGSGKYMDNGECKTCSVGYYCSGDGNQTQCEGASVTTKTGRAACTACSGDTPYANPEHTQCVACDDSATEYPNGGVCNPVCGTDHGQGTCQSCGIGFYRENRDCKVCPAGYYCPGDQYKYACSENTSSQSGSSACTECSGDTPYTNSTHTQCIACDEDGEYENDEGRCVFCSAGSYMEGNNCIECPAGAYCPGGGQIYNCSGNKVSAQAASRCTTCSGDTYANADHTQCVACDDGDREYNDEDNYNVCKTCGLGQYYGKLTNGMSGDVKRCQYCPAGAYCLGGKHYIPCPKGSYSANTGASSCLNCPVGYTTADVGATQCVVAEMKLNFSGTDKGLPSCLTKGRLNTDVIRNYSGTNVQNN